MRFTPDGRTGRSGKKLICAADPDTYGAICMVNERGKIVALDEFPLVTAKDKTSEWIARGADPVTHFYIPVLAGHLRKWPCPDVVCIESQYPRPWDGKVQIAKVMFLYGLVYGMMSMKGKKVKMITVSPQVWKKAMIPPAWRMAWGYRHSGEKKWWDDEEKGKFSRKALKTMAIERAKTICKEKAFRDLLEETADFRRESGRAEAYLIAEWCRRYSEDVD